MDIKDFKDYIRVLKEFKVYGNFMYNMHGADLYYFIDTDTCPYGMINMHACWSETPQDGNYWYYIHSKIKNFDMRLFKDKKVLDSCLNVLENKTYDVDIQW